MKKLYLLLACMLGFTGLNAQDCPKFGDVKSQDENCRSSGQIIFSVTGIPEGVYSDKFYFGYDTPSASTAFKDVVVDINGWVTIPLTAGYWGNIKYYDSNNPNCGEIVIDYGVNINAWDSYNFFPSTAIYLSLENSYFCKSDKPTVFDLQRRITVGSQNNNIRLQWYKSDSAQGNNLTPVSVFDVLGDFFYFYDYTDEVTGCKSGLSHTYFPFLVDVPQPLSEPIQYFCSLDNPTVKDIKVTIPQGRFNFNKLPYIMWTSSEVSPNGVVNSTPLINGVTYYAQSFQDTTPYGYNQCPNETTTPITVYLTNENIPTISTIEIYYWSDRLTITEPRYEEIIQYNIRAGLNESISRYEYALNDGVYQTSDTFPNIQPGIYNLKIRDSKSDCKISTKTIEVGNTLATSEYSSKTNLSVTPNPAQDQVTVAISANQIGAIFTVYDLTGRQLLTSNLKASSNSIDTSLLSKGTYIYTIVNNGQAVESKKLVIE